ncbi:MAG: HNH endonuclease [Gammaproteobacteria bacterium]|nr:HNH endonuclease [Gammaproteobacteria bacterium]
MGEFDQALDTRVRTAAFEWLSELVMRHGEVLPRRDLEGGFELGTQLVRLIGPQGIFKPALMQVPISITTSPNGPYNDAFTPSGLRYRYRGTDPEHRDNRGLRFAMRNQLPLVYFHGVVPGRYLAIWPVYVVYDLPDALAFSIAVDDAVNLGVVPDTGVEAGEAARVRRSYVTTLARRRVHQSAFRERVLRAYRHQCAFCRLRHGELLEAAHIIPDAEPEGEPVVSNGLSLCRLHHAAFDRFFVGVRPDLVIEVRPDVLVEMDGPTLKHAIQGIHGHRIDIPRSPQDQPGTAYLSERYERFLDVAANF